jgi:hypothetical protein
VCEAGGQTPEDPHGVRTVIRQKPESALIERGLQRRGNARLIPFTGAPHDAGDLWGTTRSRKGPS